MFTKVYNSVKSLFSKFFDKSQFEALSDVSLDASKKVELKYYLNDPSTPDLMGLAVNPVTYKLPFSVKHYMNAGGPFDRPQGQAANVYAVMCHSINAINRTANIEKWALVKNLNVDPLAGNMPNAYYDRQGLKFFYFNGKSGKKVFTCLSADIVSHELGHALLDAMRPEYFNMANTEIWAFHESFGDCISIFSSLAHPTLVDYILKQTGGDLKKSNLVEGLAEQFGAELGIPGALRKAVNSFVYVNPAKLPKNAPDNQLSSEVHSFSRVMTGAFYDILVAVYNHYGSNKDALAKAREFLLKTYIEANRKAPSSANFFQSFAATWIAITQPIDPQIANLMKVIFKNRQIYGVVVAQSVVSDAVFPFDKVNLGENKFDNVHVVVNHGKIKVSSLFESDILAQSEKMAELMELNMTIPLDDMVCMEDGVVCQMSVGPNVACECAKEFLDYMLDNDLYGDNESQPWYKDEHNNLVRKHITCCGDNGFVNNCLIPGNPEFGKCWKCKNNTGCCSHGSCSCEELPKKQVVLPCRTRYNACSTNKYNTGCGGSRYYSQPYGCGSASANPVPYT